ncbi:MAG TPA: glycosyltransferase family 39 protein [Planctomycetaceae bacterium]|nr:glycosyltransferase family 39 protein [Planctomycetaceae bacterium]
MTTIDDAKLERLAARRPKDLFPILERSHSLMPLLVVLTFLPGIVALESASIDELDAQWRLKSLELSTASSVSDVLDPSGISQTDLKWQPPLGSWIAAGSVHLPGPFGAHGLELVDYLSAASLVPASFFLASRLFGRRIGFITALLVALHTTFLEQHQNATPHGLAILTAMGAFWGFLGHLRHGEELVSFELLAGGISLGLCLLAGGPLALVVVVVLLALVLGPFEPLADARKTMPARRVHIWAGWPAFRSLGVLVVTAFAAGGWWELMMLYSYGGEFLSGWLGGMRASPASAGHAPLRYFSADFSLRLMREFFAMARVLSGLTLLGLWTIGRGLLSPAAGVRRASFWFLAVWFVFAFVLFAAGLREPAPGSLYWNMWRLFLMSACTACSALAVDEIARRRIGLSLFVSVTLSALLVGYFFLHQDRPGRAPSPWMLAGGLTFAIVAAQVLRRVCEKSESRQWLVLAGLIAGCVLADASIAISTIRAEDADHANWRALTTFYSSLPRAVDAEACLLISESKVPNRLLLALKSVWPTADIVPVRDWDQALTVALGEHQTPKTAVVVDWSHGNSRPANPTGAQWEAVPVGNPQFFEQRQLRAYVLVWERKPAGDENHTGEQAATLSIARDR